MTNKLLKQFVKEVVEEAMALSMGGGSLQPSGQVSGTGGYPLGGDMTAAHKKLWSGDKPEKKKKQNESSLFKGPRFDAALSHNDDDDDINAPKEYPAFGGDPNMIQGMMGTDSNYNYPPAHLNPELVNGLGGDTDPLTGKPVRRGKTVSDKLDELGPTVTQTSSEPSTKVYFEFDTSKLEGLKLAKIAKQIKAWKLPMLGAGATRIAYDLGKNRVLKVVRDAESVRSNKMEIRASLCLTERYATKIYEYDDTNYFWLVAEKVEELDPFDFLPKLREQLDYPGLANVLDFIDALSKGPKNALHNKLYETSEWYKGLFDKIHKCRVSPNDFGPNNWGVRANGSLVLLDYGFPMSESLSENVLDQQGQKKAPSTRAPYGQTYLQKDDPQRKKEMGILKKVKKNLDKKAYTLHDPPSMGISITRPHLKDRPNK